MKFSIASLLLVASLCHVQATNPLLAWSNKEFNADSSLHATVVAAQDLRRGLDSVVDCSHKTVLVVDEHGFTVNGLASSPRKSLKAEIQGAASSVQIPFVQGEFNVEALAQTFSQKCNAQFIDADQTSELDLQIPSVVYLSLQSTSAEQNDKVFGDVVSQIKEQVQDSYVVVLTSSKDTHQHLKARQLEPQPETQKPGLFHHYVFFSQGIFMALLIAVILVPIAIMGVLWNLSVQPPPRFESKPKSQ